MEVTDFNDLEEETFLNLDNDEEKVKRLQGLVLLKKKICLIDKVISSYNDTQKQCKQLTESLQKAKAEANEKKKEHDLAVSKTIKLQNKDKEQQKSLQASTRKNIELETKISGFQKKIGELETKISADKQLIQQLNCKIVEIQEKNGEKIMEFDSEKFKLEEKIKDLEQEVKKLKKSQENKKTKKNQNVNTAKVQIAENEINSNCQAKVSNDPFRNNFNKSNKSTVQNSFLCKKCEIAFNDLIQSFPTPESLIEPMSPDRKKLNSVLGDNYIEPVFNQIEKMENQLETENPPKSENSETIKVLTKTLRTLNRVIKINKKSEKKGQCCYSNHYFPNGDNQDIMLQICKKLLDREEPLQNRQPRKKVKRCKHKRKSVKKSKKNKKDSANWSIESTIDSEASNSQNENFKVPEPFNNLKPNFVSNKVCKISNLNLMTKKESNKIPRKLCTRSLGSLEKISTLRENSSGKQCGNTNIFSRVKENIANSDLELVSAQSEESESNFFPDFSSTILAGKTVLLSEESTLTAEEENLMLGKSISLQGTKSNGNSKVSKAMDLASDNETVLNSRMSLKRKEFSCNVSPEDSIIKTSSPCKSDERDTEPYKKMVCRRLISSSDSQKVVSDCQNLQSKNVQTLVTGLENKNKALSENKEDKNRINSEPEFEAFDGFEILIVEHHEQIENLDENLGEDESQKEFENLDENLGEDESQKEFENLGINIEELMKNQGFENLESEIGYLEKLSITSEAQISQDKSKIPKKNSPVQEDELPILNTVDLIGEISFSDESTIDPKETNSISNLNEKESENTSMFISSSEIANIPKNSIHGKRSSEPLIQVISPRKPGRPGRKKITEVVNANSGKTTRKTLLSKIRTLKKRSGETVATPTIKKVEEKEVFKRKMTLRKDSEKDTKAELNKRDLDESSLAVKSKKRRIAHVPRRANDLLIESPIRKSLRSASKSPKGLKIFNDNLSKVVKKPNSPKKVIVPQVLENPVVRKKGRPRKYPKQETPKENVIDSILQNKNFNSEVDLSEEKIGKQQEGTKKKVDKEQEKNKTEVGRKEKGIEKKKVEVEKIVNKEIKKRKIELKEEIENDEVEEGEIENDEIELKEEAESKEIEKGKAENEYSKTANEDLESPLSPDANIEAFIGSGNESFAIIPTEQTDTLDNEIIMKNSHWEIAMKALNVSKNLSENSEDSSIKSNSLQTDSERKEISRKFQADFKDLNLHPMNPMFNYLNSPKEKLQELTQINRDMQCMFETNVRSLLNDENWTSELHHNTVGKISAINDVSIVAKLIVDFLKNEFVHKGPLDKSNTPPAPMMTRSQQKIVTLITSLEKTMPEIFDLIFAGINYSLFRLNSSNERIILEGMTRIYTVLARLKKDREKVRLFIVDALYCFPHTAAKAIFVVLTCWPEVFPTWDSNLEILPKCMAYVILSADGSFEAMKKLLADHYKYPRGEYFPEKLASECISALEMKHETNIDLAILLLAKKMGVKWTYKTIIQGQSGLLQLIVEKRHPSSYHAFTLLGNLMRIFPENDKECKKYIKDIVEQLCALLKSNEGSEDHLEGIVSALLSLSRFKSFFGEVAKHLLLWEPRSQLRDETLEKFNSFGSSHNEKWWYRFIKCNYTAPPAIVKKKQQIKSLQKVVSNIRKRTKPNKKGIISKQHFPLTSQ